MRVRREMLPDVQRSSDVKDERLQARLSREQKVQLQRAADYKGQTLSEFVIDSAQRRAEEIIREHESMRLSADESQAFVEALLNPPAPSERIRRLAGRFMVEVLEQ